MFEIKPLSKECVHRICSGQVVADLTAAVKELVENSLDASATNIEVKLSNYGLDCIEVIDNGSGIDKNNFSALTLKHHTSKLKEFSDLASVETYGFRGEALSSLCSLAELSVITRHEGSNVGHHLTFCHNGKIKSQKRIARQRGTTVILKKLFCTLPVRKKQLTSNFRKEYTKLLNIMTAYCLISTHTQVSISNTVSGKTNIVMSTEGEKTLLENIISVYGAKQVQSIHQFQQSPHENLNGYHVTGFVSDLSYGSGRVAKDRQFVFINSRPVRFDDLVRLVNKIFQEATSSNLHPFFILNINVTRDFVDVNMNPSKRDFVIKDRDLLLDMIKSSLLEMFAKSCEGGDWVTSTAVLEEKKKTIGQPEDVEDDFASKKTTISKSLEKDKQPESSGFQSLKISNKKDLPKEIDLSTTEDLQKNTRSKDEISNSLKSQLTQSLISTSLFPIKRKVSDPKEDEGRNQNTSVRSLSFDANIIKRRKQIEDSIKIDSIWSMHKESKGSQESNLVESSSIESSKLLENDEEDQEDPGEISIIYDSHVEESEPCWEVEVDFSIEMVEEFVKNQKTTRENKKYSSSSSAFHAKIQPSQNKKAETELEKFLSKSSFSSMKVIGQFNFGFIIAKLNNDLFIVDQHASDEIYNFETLQKTEKLQKQILVHPKKLEVSPTEISILELPENQTVFEKNSFNFSINCSSGKKEVYLTTVPVCGKRVFGVSDLEELLFLLSDAPGAMCFPSSLKKMFASRACRKSVMIGKPLKVSEMNRLLNHMSEIDRPWNCPHGRPTIRHLLDLSRI